MLTTPNLQTTLRGLVRLSRWKEYVFFVVPATLTGAILALSRAGGKPDWRILAVTIANNLVVAYAFMINDIEDAPDDARDPARAARNPVCCDEVSPGVGWAASIGVALVALLLFIIPGRPLLAAVGAFSLALSHFYSWKPVRLKAWPVLDVISHALMLAGLLVLAGYLTYDNAPGPVWLVIGAAFCGSAYGQLYNQLRDFDMDKAAGLHNTAVTVGLANARLLMYGAIGAAGVGGALALAAGLIPLWLVVLAVVMYPAMLFLFRPKVDMRGSEALDISGKLQVQTNLFMTLICIIWLIGVIIEVA
jgi:4-hydroxybenzoate polyprenyltransferase